MKFKSGDEIRVVKDSCGDLPVSYMRRKGIVLGIDEYHSVYEKPLAYKVKLDMHAEKVVILWEDEMELV